MHVVGRRSAAQAAWTTAELREAVRLPGVRVALRAEEVDLDDVDAATVESSRASAIRNLHPRGEAHPACGRHWGIVRTVQR